VFHAVFSVRCAADAREGDYRRPRTLQHGDIWAAFDPRRFTPRASRGMLTTMFVVELIYTAPLAAIDAAMTAHVKYLKKHYAAGRFLVSGRKVPRDGGVILACAGTRAEIEAIVREDPFVGRGLADFRITEFRASQKADDMPDRITR
jgi:uncharacterized protein YciI